jgi:hypothetical protein
VESIPLKDCEGIEEMVDALLNPDEEKIEKNKEIAQIIEESIWDLI